MKRIPQIYTDSIDAREGLAVGEYGIFKIEDVRALENKIESLEKQLAAANLGWA